MSPKAFARVVEDFSALKTVLDGLSTAHPHVAGESLYPLDKASQKRFKRLVDNLGDSLRSLKRADNAETAAAPPVSV